MENKLQFFITILTRIQLSFNLVLVITIDIFGSQISVTNVQVEFRTWMLMTLNQNYQDLCGLKIRKFIKHDPFLMDS